jgi:multicomponent Na+:H+ antiporter subunit B
MIVVLDLAVFLILIVTAILALRSKDLLTSVALLSGYSLFLAVLFTGLLALDVALVEAALGAGLSGVLMIVAILATTRRTAGVRSRGAHLLALPTVGAFLGLMLYASTGLPDRGVIDSPAQTGVSTVYLERSLIDTKTPNVVTAILADYRSLDTLGETIVIVTAALSASLILLRRFDHPDLAAEGDVDGEVSA